MDRVDPSVCLQEETTLNLEPPTMTTSSQLEASHDEIMDGVVATVEKATETEEDLPLFRRKLQRVLRVPFSAAATKKDRILRPLINFVKQRDWEAIKASYGQYWFNIQIGSISVRPVYSWMKKTSFRHNCSTVFTSPTRDWQLFWK